VVWCVDSVCKYACWHVVRVCMCAHMWTCIRVCVYTHIRIYVCRHIDVCTYVCIIFTCVCVRVCAYQYVGHHLHRLDHRIDQNLHLGERAHGCVCVCVCVCIVYVYMPNVCARTLFIYQCTTSVYSHIMLFTYAHECQLTRSLFLAYMDMYIPLYSHNMLYRTHNMCTYNTQYV
jgi:hypothetical protein